MSKIFLRALIYTRILRNSRYGIAYYSNKKRILLKLNIPNASKETCIPVNEAIEEKTCDKIEKNAYENEDKILKLIMTEKEKDASVRSCLSKECNTLLADRKMTLTAGLNLHLELLPSKERTTVVGWENFEFDNKICAGRKHLSTPVGSTASSPCKKKSGGTPPSGSPPGSGKPPATETSARIVRGEPGQLIYAVIPVEWWKFFLPKTGVTGFWTFLFTYGVFLLSKEYLIMEHEFYNGISLFIMWAYGIKNFGHIIANNLDKQIDEYEKGWQKSRDTQKVAIESQVKDEEALQFQADGQMILMAAKKENVALQLEAEFRKRQMHVYQEVKRRLDYHLAIVHTQRRIIHKNLVDYVTREVQKSITPEMQNELINVSIKSIITEFEKQTKKK